MNNKISLILIIIFSALVVQAQDTPPPDTTWESDPLDVLESKKKTEAVEPTVPEFKDIPASGGEPKVEPTAEIDTGTPKDIPKEISKETLNDVLKEIPKETPKETAKEILKEDVKPALEKFAQPIAPVGGSGPDYSKESEFHRIYKTYNEQPTSVEVWGKVVGSKESKNYKVQKGDTLSGISKTFFGDPFFWPKVWSLNHGQILNPHEIEPGLNVQFFPGSMEDAPSLELAAAEKKGEAVVGAVEKAATVTKEAVVEMPKARKKYAPLLKILPDSLPQYKIGTDRSAPLELQIQSSKSFSSALQYLTYYINDTPIDGVGVVTGTELNLKTANEFQYIYVRMDSVGADKGYVVQKNVGPISNSQQKGRAGHMVEVEGEIEVLEPVNEQKNIYRAIVKKAIQPIEVGAILTSGKMPMINASAGQLTSGIGAKIIGGQYDRKRALFSSDSLVFLDGGASQGIQEGQSLGIFADGRIRNKTSNAVINDRMIGVVKIVRVTQNFATAYVVKASDDILLGDYVGGQMVQAATEEAMQPAASHTEPSGSANGESNGESEIQFDEAPSESPSPDSGTEDSELEL